MSWAITWDAGPTAEIEFISPEGGLENYRLRYNPPYRTSLRSPVDALRVGPQELENSLAALQRFAESIQLAGGRGPGGAAVAPAEAPVDQLKKIGLELYEFMLPAHVQSDLDDETFIELALDESLTKLPWEIMYDGEGFLSHRHPLGRFITLRTPLAANARRAGTPSQLDELKVLLVGVSRPTPSHAGEVFDPLPAVEAELAETAETLAAAGVHTTLLRDDDATYDNVRSELRKPYHIIHFSGHASFDDEHPNRSALQLFDRPLTTGALMVSFAEHPAVLCFVNGCETSRPEVAGDEDPAASWDKRYNNYGLARSFLETGTYLLGSRWRLEDAPARAFAHRFYEALLGEGQPLGKAVCAARRAVAESDEDAGCAWASYIYYGDPRIGIRPQVELNIQVPAGAAAVAEPPGAEEDLAPLRELADRYEETRAVGQPGVVRTGKMTAVVRDAAALAASSGSAIGVEDLYGESPGGRIVALAQLKAVPAPQHLSVVEQSITTPDSAFEQYLALEVASELLDALDAPQAEHLRGAIEAQVEEEGLFGTSRYALANRVLTALAQQAGEADGIALS